MQDVESIISGALAEHDLGALREQFVEQGGVVVIEDAIPPALLDALVAGVDAARNELHRNYVPRQKQGGSASRFTLDRVEGRFGDLYRSPALRKVVNELSGQTLLDCRPGDAHMYALYYYTEPGDYIGWHYDTSFYRGKRYTLLLGLIDNESCRLECDLHTRDDDHANERVVIDTKPGSIVFFDGDALWHQVTPLAEGDSERVILTFEFVTDPRMNPWRRFISDVKDAVAYFGFRDVFLGPKTS